MGSKVKLLRIPKSLKRFLTKSHPVVIGLFFMAVIVMPLKLIMNKFGYENKEATEGIEELFKLYGNHHFLLLKTIILETCYEELRYRGPVYIFSTLAWLFSIKPSLKNPLYIILLFYIVISTLFFWAPQHPFTKAEIIAAPIYIWIALKSWPLPGSLILHLLINGFVWARYYFISFF